MTEKLPPRNNEHEDSSAENLLDKLRRIRNEEAAQELMREPISSLQAKLIEKQDMMAAATMISFDTTSIEAEIEQLTIAIEAKVELDEESKTGKATKSDLLTALAERRAVVRSEDEKLAAMMQRLGDEGLLQFDPAPETNIRPVVQADPESRHFVSSNEVQSSNHVQPDPYEKPDQIDTSDSEANPPTMMINVIGTDGEIIPVDLTNVGESKAAYYRLNRSYSDEPDSLLSSEQRHALESVDKEMKNIDDNRKAQGFPPLEGRERQKNIDFYAERYYDIYCKKSKLAAQGAKPESTPLPAHPQRPVTAPASTQAEYQVPFTGEQSVDTTKDDDLDTAPDTNPKGIDILNAPLSTGENAVTESADEARELAGEESVADTDPAAEGVETPEEQPSAFDAMVKASEEKSIKSRVKVQWERYKGIDRRTKRIGGIALGATAVLIVGGGVVTSFLNTDSDESDPGGSPEVSAVTVEGITFPGECFDQQKYSDTMLAGELSGSVEVKLKKLNSDVYYNFSEPETVKLDRTDVFVDGCAMDAEAMTVDGTTITIDRTKVVPQLAAGVNNTSIGNLNRDNIKDQPVAKSEAEQSKMTDKEKNAEKAKMTQEDIVWLTETLQVGDPYSKIINNSVAQIANEAAANETYKTGLEKSLDEQITIGIAPQVAEYAKKAEVDPKDVKIAIEGKYPDVKVMNTFPADQRAAVDGDTAKVKLKPSKGDDTDAKYVKFEPNVKK